VAFGLALQNSPLAIVLYFVLPTALSVIAEIVQRLQDPLRWVDINLTLPELYQPDVTATDWARAGVSVLVWVVLVFAIGVLRTSRREVV
jgi:ABC-2 type transport system permease protein